MATPKGYPSQEKDLRIEAQHATVEPIRTKQHGLTVLAHMFTTKIADNDAVEANSTTSVINATAHLAQKGDVIYFRSGALSGQEVKVDSVAANTITLAETLPSAPATGVLFDILRHKYPTIDDEGAIQVSVAPSPIAYEEDNSDQTVTLDTVTPANSKALPVRQIQASGAPVDVATEAKQDDIITLLTDLARGAGAVDADTLRVALSNEDKALLDGLEGLITTLNGYVDGLEGLATSLNGYSDGVEALIGTTNTTLSSISGYVDGLEALATALNGYVDGLEGYVDGIETALAGIATEATLLAASAKLPASLGAKASAASLSVVIANDQTVPTRPASNAAGSQTTSTVSTSAATLTAPANAVGFLLQASSSNTDNLRWRIGSAATVSAGQQLEPGRDTGYIPCAANISIISEANTNEYQVQWVLTS